MLKIEISPHVELIFNKAKNASILLKNKSINEDLLFNSFMSNISSSCSLAFDGCGIDPKALWEESNKYISPKKNTEGSDVFSKKSRDIISFAKDLCAHQFDQNYLSSEILFLAFFVDGHIPKALKSFFKVDNTIEILSIPSVKSLFERITAIVKDQEHLLENNNSEFGIDKEDADPPDWIPMFEENEILSKFADNLNIQAANGEFDKIIDFDNKVSEMATVLCRKKKPNVILVGSAGVGKTAIVGLLADQIVKGEAPDLLSNKVIYSVNLSSMVAGTQYRGQFEKRLEEFITEAKKYSNLILFIDEIHTLVGAGGGSASSLEASNILKPELAKGSISCIGATTINEYTHTIKKDAALDRRFERVIVREPSKFKMQEILPDILEYYEDFHGVKYNSEFIHNVVDYCERFLPNRTYPDKAIDVIDHCGAQAKVKFWEMDQGVKEHQKSIMKKVEETGSVSSDEIDDLNAKICAWEDKIMDSNAEVKLCHLKSFFEIKGSPLNKIATIQSLALETKSCFVGNKQQLNNLFESMRIATLGITYKHNDSAPDIFLISGESSTGKTLLCKTLQNSLERNGANIISYNGTEFSDNYGPYKIVSHHNNNTSLAEKILIHPNSIIIIDDLEKIHHSCNSLLSQIFKEGKLQMSNGEIADFSNCKFLLTSGLQTHSSMGFVKNNSLAEPNLSKEILSMVGNKISLLPLNKIGLRRILYNKLNKIKLAANLKDCQLIFNFSFLKKFVDDNFKSENSVKFLNSAIENQLITKLSKQILAGEIKIELLA